MTIRIVTDSTCDLPKEIADAYGIIVIPCYINIGARSFLDGVDLSRQEFYARLPTYEPFPKTAAPSSEMFHAAYERLVEEGATEILSIHLSSTLSALFNVAALGAQDVRGATVTTFDSRQLSLGLGWQATTAAQMVTAGKSVSEIVAALREQIGRTHTCAALDTLENLRRGGRVSRLVASLGTALQIKPLVRVHDGEVSIEKTRTRKGALERLMNLIRELGALEHAAIVYTDHSERGEELRQLLRPFCPWAERALSIQVTPIIGAHLGPGAVGVACVAEQIGLG
ncbi:MAG: DegV family protein [Chloroflexota bacterium]